jgi:hypothetical protein
MPSHQTCSKCGSSFVGPDCNIGSNQCPACGPSDEDWAEAWDAVRADILAEPDKPAEIINWALDCLDARDPR